MPRRILEGEVVSDKTDKTVTVLVVRRYRHPVYKKYVKRTDKYAAHDEANRFKTGDRVQIVECRPISKTKRWTVVTEEGNQPPALVERKDKAPIVKVEVKKVPAKKAASPKPSASKAASKKPVTKKVSKED
ncbi:MAG: 30S ribosomal protein S17 [Alphaproteobacteria bacterium]|nr:30S ribosomal protein S17 [Alphaproteobacteria bacterium]